jgi:hypothetical protein
VGRRCAVLIDGLDGRGWAPVYRWGGLTGRVEVGAFSVVVEDDEDLDRAVVGSDGVRNHGGELCRVARFDQDGLIPELQASGS